MLCQKFSQYLKVGGDSSSLIRILEKIEGHLRQSGTRFMNGDALTRADCYLLPSMQHIRVAGKVLHPQHASFFSFRVTVNTEAGMTVHNQRRGLVQA